MINIAIQILWLCIGIIIILGAVYGFFWVIKFMNVPVPDKLEKGAYVVVLLLIIIAALSILTGGGSLAPISFR